MAYFAFFGEQRDQGGGEPTLFARGRYNRAGVEGVVLGCPRGAEKTPRVLRLSKGHPLARRAKADFMGLLNEETVRQYPLIVAEMQIEGYLLTETFAQHGLTLNIGIEVGTFDTLKHYVARGLGIAVIPGLCTTEADRARLEIIPVPAQLGGDTTYGVIMRLGKHRSRLLVDLLRLLGAVDALDGRRAADRSALRVGPASAS